MTPQEAEVTELPASPGARLKREREARGLTEQQAAETLTLDQSVVFALEANDFQSLGAPVFVKGHLRRYATMLGLPADEILVSYERSKQHMAEPTLVPKSRLEMMPVRGRRKWPWVLGGAIAFVLAALLAAYVSENGLPWVDRADDAAAIQTDAAGTATDASLPAPDPTITPADPIPTPSTDATAAAAPGAPSLTDGGATADTAGPAVAPGAEPTTGPATAAAVAPRQVRLQLRFSGDSWVEVFDGSGRAVLYDLGKGGTERTLTATAPLSVTVGNAASVAVAVNGKTVAAPRQSGQVMARFSIAADGTLR